MKEKDNGMKVKFLSNGKKVVVVGKLNNTEFIVQEIFCTEDGAEIPSGERFVVKSLHDAPVQSWGDRRIAENEGALARIEKQVAVESDKLRQAQIIAAAKIRSLRAIANEVTEDSLAELESFVSGDVKYVVKLNWNGCQIAKFDEALASKDDWSNTASGLKLLSLFGQADGTLQWRIHLYSDHSGGSDTILPATSLQDATAKAQTFYDELVDDWRNGDATHPPKLDWLRGDCGRIEIPNDVKKWHNAKAKDAKKKQIAELEAKLTELQKGIAR